MIYKTIFWKQFLEKQPGVRNILTRALEEREELGFSTELHETLAPSFRR